MDFQPFDPSQATEEDFREIYDLAMARHAVDWPEITPSTYDGLVSRIRNAGIGSHPETLWWARVDGVLVATAHYEIYLEENPHLVVLSISVHPEWRRQGIGTAFFREMLAQTRRDGRSRILAPHVRSGTGGEVWAALMGFTSGQRFVMQQLDVAEVDHALWDVSTPDGYRLVEWIDTAPEEILDSYARARHAIEDSMKGDLTWVEPDWTPERIRQDEADCLAQQRETRTVVAVDEASGEVVAVTQLFIRLAQPEKSFQEDTAVVRGHRGHGLGRVVKAAMMRRLVADRPNLASVWTQTADIANMARINTELGYRTLTEYLWVEADVADLEKHVGLG
jgi:mycothiol synthase